MPIKIIVEPLAVRFVGWNALTDGWWQQEDGSVWYIDGDKAICFNNSKQGERLFMYSKRGNCSPSGGNFLSIKEPEITVKI